MDSSVSARRAQLPTPITGGAGIRRALELAEICRKLATAPRRLAPTSKPAAGKEPIGDGGRGQCYLFR